jgi:hypothetical protein
MSRIFRTVCPILSFKVFKINSVDCASTLQRFELGLEEKKLVFAFLLNHLQNPNGNERLIFEKKFLKIGKCKLFF